VTCLALFIRRTPMPKLAIGNLPFGALAKDALQVGNWIGRIGERIGPLLLETRMNDLTHNRVSQIFFALEVMKQRAFGRSRIIYDAIEATALESVFVKFVESGIEDSLSRAFWRSGRGCLHSSLQYRPVGMCQRSISVFFSEFEPTRNQKIVYRYFSHGGKSGPRD